MVGCQNYGPFLDPYYNTAPNIEGTQKGTPNFGKLPHDYQVHLRDLNWLGLSTLPRTPGRI